MATDHEYSLHQAAQLGAASYAIAELLAHIIHAKPITDRATLAAVAATVGLPTDSPITHDDIENWANDRGHQAGQPTPETVTGQPVVVGPGPAYKKGIPLVTGPELPEVDTP